MLNKLSIKHKLIGLAMLTSGMALAVACLSFLSYDVYRFRTAMVEQMSVAADIVGVNSTAAVSFHDPAGAADTMASLRAEPSIEAAGIYLPDGSVFATYFRDRPLELPPVDGLVPGSHRFSRDRLELLRPIALNGAQVGTVYVRADLKELDQLFWRYVMILGGVVVAALGLALVLASRLQRTISGPVLHLTGVSKQVSAEKNYAVRARCRSGDELGELVGCFNDMLDQIQMRDVQLQAHKDHLEEQVSSRTEQLRAVNAQLTVAKEAAEAASRAKTQFLANMSHEIRTPMTAIVGYIDMVLEPDANPAERNEQLQIIRRNGHHLLELINDILDISKIEAGKMTVERVRCDLPALVSEVVSLMRPKALERRLAFNVESPGPLPRYVLTDPLRLKQILMNLLANAIKFTKAGSVTLDVRCEALDGTSLVRFDVIDTGIGMSAEQLRRIFQPFSQADDSMSRRYGGTGLGLTISQRLARLLGGDVVVRSEPGQGSTFIVTVGGGPLEGVELVERLADALCLRDKSHEIDRPLALKGRVLLAEDGKDNQRLISAHLRRVGLEVVVAENGELAIDLLERHQVDLILMDMQMPELDGYEATRRIRQDGHTLPIVALTAHAMAEDRAKCIDAGCTDYLTKPIDRELLLRTIGQHLAQARARADEASAPSQSATPAAQAGQWARGLQDHLQRQDLRALEELVRQIRAAGGTDGAAPLAAAAAGAEDALRAGAAVEQVRRHVNEMLALIRSTASSPSPGPSGPAGRPV